MTGYKSLRDWMRAAGYTIRALAQKLEVTPCTVNRWRQERVPKLKDAKRLVHLSGGALTVKTLIGEIPVSRRGKTVVGRKKLLQKMLNEFTSGPNDTEMKEFIEKFVSSL